MKNKFTGYLQIVFGCLIYVIGINLFLAPANIFTTGLMGIAQESAQTINLIFGIGLSNSDSKFLLIQTCIYWAMNLPMIIFGFMKVGKKFTLKTLMTSLVIIQIFINVITINHSLIVDVGGDLTLAAELLSLITGSILIGIGLGLIIKNQASAGGTDILAIYLSLFKKKSFGLYNLLINLVVVIWAVALTGDLTNGVLILISLYIQSYVVDLTYNYNSKVTVLIFTTKIKEVGDYIIDNNRTYTFVDAKKGYTKEATNMLVVVLNKEEKDILSDEVLAIDEGAFIDILHTEKIVGNFKNRYLENL